MTLKSEPVSESWHMAQPPVVPPPGLRRHGKVQPVRSLCNVTRRRRRARALPPVCLYASGSLTLASHGFLRAALSFKFLIMIAALNLRSFIMIEPGFMTTVTTRSRSPHGSLQIIVRGFRLGFRLRYIKSVPNGTR